MTFSIFASARTINVCRAAGALLFSAGLLTSAAGAQSSLGPNVLVFDPSMPTSQIQATVNSIANQQVSNQFGPQRYALLFKPGVYGADTPLIIQVGFYTEVAGLGASPTDVTINGHVDVYNQCDSSGCIALDNFWRSVSNLTINVKGLSGCYSSGDFWAVSQAAPMRRVKVTGGNLTLMDYCTGPSFASGGFIADTATQFIVNGSQQQFYVRNSTITGWSNALWNQVFSGVPGAPAQGYPNPTYTTLATTPASREKPFLYVDPAGNYNVFAPALQTNSAGTTWSTGSSAGRSLPLSSFFIAKPGTSGLQMNVALASGKNLLLTPGVYQLERSLEVRRPDTVVLALGDATLVPQNGTPAITIADVDGVQVAGLIVDAGPVSSPVLFQIGNPNVARPANAQNPVTLSDVFFRIGGATVGSANTSLQVNHDNVILDDIWAWRADHGNPGTVGWTVNTANHGLVVNGNNVTATGLAVEHYQQEQVLWNGNGGTTLFYQSELPYDVPSQAAWSDNGANGYPSYVVSSNVTTHTAYGLGIYSFFNQGLPIIEDNAMTVPTGSGIAIHDVGTVWLAGSGEIANVINGVGGSASSSNPDTVVPVVSYP